MPDNELLLAMSEMLDNKLTPINQKISDIIVHLENVTDKNIKIIAEGHADLSRKLDETLKIENEKELLLIRMSYLEDKVRKIKKRLAEIA